MNRDSPRSARGNVWCWELNLWFQQAKPVHFLFFWGWGLGNRCKAELYCWAISPAKVISWDGKIGVRCAQVPDLQGMCEAANSISTLLSQHCYSESNPSALGMWPRRGVDIKHAPSLYIFQYIHEILCWVPSAFWHLPWIKKRKIEKELWSLKGVHTSLWQGHTPHRSSALAQKHCSPNSHHKHRSARWLPPCHGCSAGSACWASCASFQFLCHNTRINTGQSFLWKKRAPI